MSKRKYEYRYRDHSGGITRPSLRRVADNLHKIGQPTLVRGYCYVGRFKWGNAKEEAVLVRGERGTARFEGFLWGYHGEGPRGLVQLLIRLGVKKPDALRIAHDTPRCYVPGTDWELEIKSNAYVLRVKGQEPVVFSA
jgi:hypothetical protein